MFFFFQAEDGIRDRNVTGVQTCALPILTCSTTMTKATGEPHDEFRTHREHRKFEILRTDARGRRRKIGRGEEIGRASCRERVKIVEDDETRKIKQTNKYRQFNTLTLSA